MRLKVFVFILCEIYLLCRPRSLFVFHLCNFSTFIFYYTLPSSLTYPTTTPLPSPHPLYYITPPYLPMFLNKSHQKLKEIPFIDENITHVDLRRNEIQNISISNLNIVYLDLSDNKISEISNLNSFQNLLILDLSYNLITNITSLPPNLQELYLIANDIKAIECTINLKFCKILDLAVNEIKEIDFLKGCDELKELYLGSNKIKRIKEIPQNLTLLDLQNNLLEEIDCSLLPKKIKTLLLSDNANLKCIKNIDTLKDLKLLTIERTKIEEIEVGEGIEIWK